MKRRVSVLFFVLVVFVIAISGCATIGRQSQAENQTLRNQVAALETQIQQKDVEIDSLRKALSQTTEEKYAVMKGTRLKAEVTTKPTTKQIQTALKNAGYDPGSIDGRMGQVTRTAIKDFQKANNLAVDGKAGKQTWNLLVQYLNKTEK